MKHRAGYTLLEMVIVLAVMALATAMVAPASYRMIGTWREAGEVEQVRAELAALPTKARVEGRELRLQPGEEEALAKLVELPEGWHVELDQPLRVGANGACTGARGTLKTMRQTLSFDIAPPFCKVQILAPEGS